MQKSTQTISLALILVFAITSTCTAQSWLSRGAKWHTGIIESFFSINQGYIRSTVIGDSIIMGQNTRIIISERFSSQNQLSGTDTSFFYDTNGKIYHYRSGQFYKLYDYNLMPGDTWQISVAYPSPFATISITSPDTIVDIVVDSTGYQMIDGQSRKLQYVHSVNNNWYFLNPIIEGIGSSGGFFPFIYDWLDNDIPLLRCYTDSQVFYQANSNVPCDTLLNSIETYKMQSVQIFPNPFHNSFFIKNESDNLIEEIYLFDILGKECFRKKGDNLTASEIIDASGLPSGIYICKVKSSSIGFNVRIIKD